MASKFADAVVMRFRKGKPAETDPPEDDGEGKGGDAATKDDDDQAEAKPGAKGKMLAAALKKGNGEQIEEIVKSICGY